MCRYMNVSRSGYYEWLCNIEEGLRLKEDRELTKMIKQIFKEGRDTYGSRRIRQKMVQKKIVMRLNLLLYRDCLD